MAIAIVLIIMFYILKAKPNGQGDTQNKAHTRVESAAERSTFHDDRGVCLFVCVACCSGKVVKVVEAQTNKQEDKKDVPGETTHTHTRGRARAKLTGAYW